MQRNKIIIAAIISTVALSATGISLSLAWYASSDRLLVNTIDIDLRTDAHLLISTSPEKETFKESLTQKELNEVKEFIPTSSMNQSSWMNDKSEVPLFYDTSSDIAPMGIPQLQVSDKGFYQQKLYLLSDINYYVTIDVEQSFLRSDEAANTLRAQALAGEISELSQDEILEKLNKLENSMRISILVTNPEHYAYYIIDPHKEEDDVTYYAGRLDNNGDGYFDTYPEATDQPEKEIIYGEIENRNEIKYDDPKSDVLEPNPDYDPFQNHFFGNSFVGKSKQNAYTYNEKDSLDAGVKYKEEPSIALEDLAKDDNPLLIPCYNGVVTEIVLSIYLEGWDKDCYNSTMGASFEIALSFKLLKGGI